MSGRRTNSLVAAALLSSVALMIFWVEAQLPSLTPVPGIKLGLANVVTLFALYEFGPLFALAVLVVRILLGGLLTGQAMAIAYSLSGGLLAFAAGALLRRFFPANQVWALSVIMAAAHNTGQISAAIAITRTPELLLYYPVLIFSAVVTGAFTGLCAQFLLLKLRKAGAPWPRGGGQAGNK